MNIIQLDNYDSGNTSTDTVGYFDKENPDRLLLDIDYVNMIENGTVTETDNSAYMFFSWCYYIT
ncbi:MAG: hypothetical protein IIC67_00315 [Thaumarchaeota archaeon]|nr:hypothetical protein [Nitrososphaerota archaeon]